MACSAFTSPHNLICRERRVETNAANENYSLDFHRNPKADARWMNREEFPFSSGVIGHQIASKPLEQWSIGQLHVERQSLSKVVASLWMAIRAAVEGRCKWSRREKVFRMVTWAATGSTWFFDLFFFRRFRYQLTTWHSKFSSLVSGCMQSTRAPTHHSRRRGAFSLNGVSSCAVIFCLRNGNLKCWFVRLFCAFSFSINRKRFQFRSRSEIYQNIWLSDFLPSKRIFYSLRASVNYFISVESELVPGEVAGPSRTRHLKAWRGENWKHLLIT